MAETKQAKETQPEKKNGQKAEPQPVSGLANEAAGLGGPSAAPVIAAGDGSAETQARRLGDRQVQTAQRQALANQVGRRQGNQHLQRVLVAMMVSGSAVPAPAAPQPGSQLAPVVQRDDDEPTEEEKARARAAARLAEQVAGQAADEGHGQTEKSRNEKAAEQEKGQAAQGKKEQVSAEAAGKAADQAAAQPAGAKATPEAEPKAAAATGAAAAAPGEGAGAAVAPVEAAGKNGTGGAGTPAEAPAPASAEEDPAFQAVVKNVKGVGAKEKAHAPAKAKAGEAQAAAEAPASEVEARAQGNQVEAMEKTEAPGFNAAAFKAQLMKRIQELAPKTVEEADNFKKDNKLAGVKDEAKSKASAEQNAAKKPLEDKASAAPDTASVAPKPVSPLPPAEPGAAPPDIGADAAAPKVKGQGEVETPLQENSRKVDQQMAEANVTEKQLQNSNEPEFTAALDSKREAQTHAVTAPQEYRQFEGDTLAQAQGAAVAAAQERTEAMHAGRSALLTQVGGQQGQAKSEDEQARARVASDIQKIYARTQANVERILGELDGKVEKTFDEGASAAKQAFEDYVAAKMDAYKEDRYGGWFGWARWAKDKLAGMPSEVNVFYSEGRQLFLDKMDAVIDTVASIVATGLTEAKAEIANGKKEIAAYLAQLPNDLKRVGQQAAQDIQGKFDDLERSVEDKQNELVDTLAHKYQENLQAVDDRIEELKAANAGLIEKAINAVVGVIKIILKLMDFLLTVLAKVAEVVGTIIDDPIGFLGNLIDAVGQGFKNFAANIKKHLIGGLVGWLTGALGPMGIELPEDLFSLEGIFSLVVQILGLGWDFIRAKAVKLLGEPVVQALEQGFELFKVLAEKGPLGLWEYLKDQFSDLKETILDAIQDMIKSEVIEAGVKWIFSLLTPAGAFIKAAQAIYKIVLFFVEKGSQIMDLVNSIIDGIAAVASGAISGAAALIENALAKALPLVIGFLASLLGLDDLAEKVQKIIKRIRARIEKAIDDLILKAKKYAGKALSKLGFGKKEERQAAGAAPAEAEDDTGTTNNMIRQEEKQYIDEEGAISHADAVKTARAVEQKEHGSVSINVVDAGAKWEYNVVMRAATKKKEATPVQMELLSRRTRELQNRVHRLTAELQENNPKKFHEHEATLIDAAGTCEVILSELKTGSMQFAKLDQYDDELNAKHEPAIHAIEEEIAQLPQHPSQYAEIEDGKYILKPEYRKNEFVRGACYGTSYRQEIYDWKDELLTKPETAGGIQHPTDPNQYKWNNRWWVNSGTTQASIEHTYKVVTHWNDTGHNTTQSVRKNFYNDKSKLIIMPLSLNSSEGALAGERYTFQVGEEFLGPVES